MTKRQIRTLVSRFRERAELLRALAHPTRLAIVEKLAKGPKCVTDIQELLDVPQANISQHLTVLRGQRIVSFHEDGKLRCYYLTRPDMGTFVEEFLRAGLPIVERSQDEVRRAGRKKKTARACS